MNYEKIISYEALYRAHRRARLGKRHKRDVIETELALSNRLWDLHYDLKYGKYRPGAYRRFMIHDPKTREIQAINYRDRLVQHALCDNFLTPFFDKRLIFDNCACRVGKGTGFAVSRLRSFMLKYYKKHGLNGYFVKCDIKKYFDSVDHSILKARLAKIIGEDRIIDLICTIIDSYCHHKDCGLPMGNQTSQCFALYYLDSVDRLIKEKLRVKYYVRYMDDMVLIVKNKAEAEYCLAEIGNAGQSLNLELNRKSQIIAFHNGVEFLGWRFFIAKSGKLVQKLKRQAKDRIIAKCKDKCRDVKIEREKSFICYNAYLINSNSYRFTNKIDHILE